MKIESVSRLSKDTKVCIFILALAFVIRVVWLLQVNTQPVTDFDWYFERAREIANGMGYQVHGKPTAYWPVGYPAALSVFFKVFGAKVALAKLLNSALVLASIYLSWRIARRLFENPWVAHGVAFILALHPAYIAYSGILASEPLYTALTLLGIAICLQQGQSKVRLMIGAGVVFGCATLVRPQAVLIPAIVLLCFLSSLRAELSLKQILVRGLWVYVALIVTLVPWTVRNYIVFDRLIFVSTNGGDNLLIGNNPSADGTYSNPENLGVNLLELSEPERDMIASQSAKEFIRKDLSFFVSNWRPKLAATFMTGTDSPYWAFQKHKGVLSIPGVGDDKRAFKSFQQYSIKFTNWLYWLSLFSFVFAFLKKKNCWICISLVSYNALITMIFFGNARFSFPVIPFLAMMICHAISLLVPPRETPIPELQSS